MTDKFDPKNLESALARLKQNWQELVDVLTSQGNPQERVLEVAKILLRDAVDQYCVKISANPDSSADLILTDIEGNDWARLGVNLDGEAFLELKGKKVERSFKVAMGSLSPGAVAGPAARPPDAAPQPKINAVAEPPSGAATFPPGPEAQSLDNTNLGLVHQLEKLEIQNRRQKFHGALILGVLGVVLVVMAYTLFCPYRSSLSAVSLTVRDLTGQSWATLGAEDGKVKLDLWDQNTRRATLGLGSQRVPYLEFYDREHRLRADLNLSPDGEPRFTLRETRSLKGQKESKPTDESAHQRPPGGTSLGSEGGVLPSPPAGLAEAVSPTKNAEGEFVGFRKSNKYHYPICRWARGANSGNSIKFKSAEEALARHYVPCPVCKPPRLSR